MGPLLCLFLLLQGDLADGRDTAGRPGTSPPAAASVVEGEEPPDVLIVVGDDFNWTDVGEVPLPNLDALAARGMTFRNFYSFPNCSLTRYSLLFGRYPRRDGIGRLVGIDPPGPGSPAPPLLLRSLPEVVRSHPLGYARSALIGKWHLGTNADYDGDPAPDLGPYDTGALTPQWHGFDRFLAGTMSNLPQGVDGGSYSNWLRVDDGVYSLSTRYAPAAQLEAFRGWWALPGRKLAVLASNLPHAPFHTPPPAWRPPTARAAPPGVNRDRFEAMLQAFDLLVGRVLADVDLERTWVFVLSDNGTQPSVALDACPSGATFEGCTKSTVWQGGVRVPMWVAGPGIPAGASTDAVVSSTDLMATIAGLLGVESPGEDSISFAPVLADPAARTRRVAFVEIFGTFTDPSGAPYERVERAAIGERYKLRELDGAEALYDLLQDPGETVQLSPGDPRYSAVAAELRAVLADPLDRELQRLP